MRLKRTALLLPLVLLTAPGLRAEYIVLRSGQRLTVTGYQLVGDKYRLQMAGGSVEVAAEEVVTIEPEEVFTPVPAKPVVKPPYRELIEAAASRYNVDADLVSSVIAVESNFDPKAVSRKNARGLMQLLPETAARLGVKNMDDPKENIEAGTRYLSELLQMYKNDLVLGVPPFAETLSYVRRVKHGYEKSKSNASPKTTTQPGAMAATSAPRASQPQ